jgi:preprotein translocase subunit SecG
VYTVFVFLHLLVCGFLIFIVLIQSSKGAEWGAAFGGSNQTLFGSRGAATFLNKLTTGAAVLFMLTSLTLAVLSSKGGSIMPERVRAQESTSGPFTSGPVEGQPVTPEQTMPGGGQGEVHETPLPLVE